MSLREQVDELLQAVGTHAYVAGSAARILILSDGTFDKYVPEIAGDIDLFCYQQFNLDLIDKLYDLGYLYSSESGFARTLTRNDADLPLQVVTNRFGLPEDMLATFPLDVQQFALTYNDAEGLVGFAAPIPIEAALRKLMAINFEGCDNPAGIWQSVLDYAKKGYRLDLVSAFEFMEWYREHPKTDIEWMDAWKGYAVPNTIATPIIHTTGDFVLRT